MLQRCSERGCKKWATHLSPAPFCDRDWARRNSTQFDPPVAEALGLSTPYVPYRVYLDWQLKNRGLDRREGETNEERYQRCKERVKKSNVLSS